MIVITSDHGDYLGDHWMGEKNLFHECSIKVPLIIYDPRPEADATRGTVCDELVEAIDLLPTFMDVAGAEQVPHITEGRSLTPLLHGQGTEWRDYAVAEFDYSIMPLLDELGLEPKDGRLFMVADKKWKFMHAEGGLPPMLFDLENDPDELVDLGQKAEHAGVVNLMYERLREWGLRMSQRLTVSDGDLARKRGKSLHKGILLGVYEPDELPPEFTAKQRVPVPRT